MEPIPALEKCRVEELVGESILDFSVCAGCAEGDGVTGILTQIKLRTLSPIKEVHLVLKEMNKSSILGAQRILDSGYFVVEKTSYSVLFPMLSDFIKSRHPPIQNLPLPVPNLYSCYQGENPLEEYICMEDVRVSGYKMANKYTGLNLKETLLVLSEIGKFHALTYGLIQLKSESIFTGTLRPFVQFNNIEALEKEPRILRVCASRIARLEDALELIQTMSPVLYERMKTFCSTTQRLEVDPKVQFGLSYGTDSKHFPVIVHGDLWVNNILFKYNGNTPVDLRFIDFQLCRRGNIYEDLLNFVYSSTTPKLRSDYPLATLLKTYYDTFCLTLEQIQTPLPTGFTLDVLVDEFRSKIPIAFSRICSAMSFQLGTPMSEVTTLMQENGDCGSDGKKTNMFLMGLKTNTEAMKRLLHLTQEMADLNVI